MKKSKTSAKPTKKKPAPKKTARQKRQTPSIAFDELKLEHDRLQSEIYKVRKSVADHKAQPRRRLEKRFAEMLKAEIFDRLNLAVDYLSKLHPEVTGKPVAEVLSEVVIRSFHALETATVFTGIKEPEADVLAFFQRLLDRRRKASAAEKKRARINANNHAFRSFCEDAILLALYLAQNGWQRHWLLQMAFPKSLNDEKNWTPYLLTLISKCFEASLEEYPLSRPEINGYVCSRLHPQAKPVIKEIFNLEKSEFERRMDFFVFWKLEMFVTQGRSPAHKVLAERFPSCLAKT
jgi:hypothetical protein